MSYPGNRRRQEQQQYNGPPGFPQPNHQYQAPPGPPQAYGQEYGAKFPIPGGYGAPLGPPPGQYQQPYPQQPNAPYNHRGPSYGGGGYNQGPPQHQYYNQNGPGYSQGNQGYNQNQGGNGFPHPQPMNQYAAPPGAPPNSLNFQPPPGPPPMSYNNYNPALAPPQYKNFAVHSQPVNQGVYSSCNGRRKALLIGINYTGTKQELRGCHNDAKNLSKFLIDRYNFKKDDMVILMDERGAGPMQIPTRANIARAMDWLVRDAKPGDSLFFHYSGHGGTMEDTDGDESDGYDETIYPLDHETAGQMVDDEMHDRMVRPLPQGCRLTAIYDSCHSGTALDLPYVYSTQGKLKGPNKFKDAGQGAMGAASAYLRGDIGGVFSSVLNTGKKLMVNDSDRQRVRADKSSLADVIQWSGCKDDQTSADAQEAGQATGAMSWAFMLALTKYPQQSYMQLLNTIRDELKSKYTQKPQLSCSHELDCDLLFII